MSDIKTAGNKKNPILRFLEIREIGALIPLVLIFIVVSFVNNSFFSLPNILNMLRASSYIFIVAVGMTFVLCGRGLDLSVGSQMALTGVIMGVVLVQWQLPIWLGLIITVAMGALTGAVNGFFVAHIGIPPFIATLATFYGYRGIVLGITKGSPITPMPEALKVLGQGSFLGVVYVVWFMALLFFVATFVLRMTKFGRYTLAMGGNAESTRLAGVNTKRLTFSLYVLSGVLACVAGLFFTARFSSAQPTAGIGLELQVIAACIIGGVSLFGGSGSILGTLIGAMFLIVLNNGMIMVHISAYWQQTVVGAIIILAIVIDLIRKGDLLRKA